MYEACIYIHNAYNEFMSTVSFLIAIEVGLAYINIIINRKCYLLLRIIRLNYVAKDCNERSGSDLIILPNCLNIKKKRKGGIPLINPIIVQVWLILINIFYYYRISRYWSASSSWQGPNILARVVHMIGGFIFQI